MTDRRRAKIVGAFLVASAIVCATVRVDGIRRDLTVRTQQALAAAGVAFYGIEIRGRDVRLHGFVRSRNEGEKISQIIAEVRGVRAVSSDLIVEHVAESQRASAVAPPMLRLQRLGARLFLAGQFPAGPYRGRLAAAAAQRFGPDSIMDNVRQRKALDSPAWLREVAVLIQIMARLHDRGRLVIEGSTALLVGQVGDPEAGAEIRRLASSVPGLRWRFEIVDGNGMPVIGSAGG